MKLRTGSRREFLKKAGLVVGSAALRPQAIFAREISRAGEVSSTAPQSERGADYTLHIKASAVEIAPKRIVSMTTYNGQFPGPLMRFQDGREVTIEIFNDTDTPEQLHWHGQITTIIEKYGTVIATSLLHLSSSQSYGFLESANNRRAELQ